MRLILTRHGQTYHNALGISMGQGLDGPLNDEGVSQATRAAEWLKTEDLSHVYFSTLQRAVHTADLLLQFHPHTIKIPAPALRERNLGIYEGRPNIEWKAAMTRSPLPFHMFRPENGESYQDLYQRVSSFYEELLQSHNSEDRVLLVSHTGALAMLLLRILGQSITKEAYDRFKPGNTAMTILDCVPGHTPIVQALNSTDHLNSAMVSRAA